MPAGNDILLARECIKKKGRSIVVRLLYIFIEMMQNVCLTSRKQNFNENSIINKIMAMVSSWLFFRTGPVGKAWEAAIAWFYAKPAVMSDIAC